MKIKIPVIIILLFIACAAVIAVESAQTNPVPAYQGWHVEGDRLLDARGNPVLLRGINSSGLEFGEANGAPLRGGGIFSYWHRHSAQEYANIAQWGFNIVRLPVSWENIEPDAPVAGQHRYNEVYLGAIDEAIRLAGQRGLPVVLSMHHNHWSGGHSYQLPNGKAIHGGGMPKWLYPEGDHFAAEDRLFADDQGGQGYLMDVWMMLARRYINTDNMIGIDVYNEAPHRRNAGDMAKAVAGLTGLYDRAAGKLHAVNPKLLLVFQDFADHDPRLTRLPQNVNAIYSFHAYQPPWPAGKNNFEAHLNRAKQLGVPVWIGEFGRLGGPDWKQELQGQINYMKTNRISWCVWAYQMYNWPLFGPVGQGPLDKEQLSILQSGMQ